MLSIRLLVLVVGLIGATAILPGAYAEEHKKYGSHPVGDIMALDVVSRSCCFDGTQFIYQHQSSETGTMMRFAAFAPPQAHQSPFPVLWLLIGSACP